MKILAIDQSRCGGYAIFDYGTKKLISYGAFNFPDRKYTYPWAIYKLKKLVKSLVKENDICACFIEEISYQRNLNGFKRLAQMQGVLENFFNGDKNYSNQNLIGWSASKKGQRVVEFGNVSGFYRVRHAKIDGKLFGINDNVTLTERPFIQKYVNPIEKIAIDNRYPNEIIEIYGVRA